jgi:hypothetical protein
MLLQKWAIWPEREDFSDEFTRLLISAQEGGATVSECLLAASRIDSNDDFSWHREWQKLADLNNERGQAAMRMGDMPTALSNWRRALNYHQAAAFPFEKTDPRYRAALARMRACGRDYVRYRMGRSWPAGST